MDKYTQSLRTTLKQVRMSTSAQFRTTSSLKICNKIKALQQYRKAKHLALYFASNGEVDLTSLWKTAPLHGKYCYFPIINKDLTLAFVRTMPNTSFKINKFGIPEPDVNIEQAKSPEELDMIIMPTLGFDPYCSRLGMGSGCYDRTLGNKKNTFLLGVAYQFQCVDFLNSAPWDVPLDAVFTEKKSYWR